MLTFTEKSTPVSGNSIFEGKKETEDPKSTSMLGSQPVNKTYSMFGGKPKAPSSLGGGSQSLFGKKDDKSDDKEGEKKPDNSINKNLFGSKKTEGEDIKGNNGKSKGLFGPNPPQNEDKSKISISASKPNTLFGGKASETKAENGKTSSVFGAKEGKKDENKGLSKAIFSKLDSSDPKDKSPFATSVNPSSALGTFGSKNGTEMKKESATGKS